MQIKQALISVYDKTGVLEFAKNLLEMGVKIISSGGTAKTLKNGGVDCVEISEVTSFPEILDGRVKTLNPKIHGGILAKRSDAKHLQELKKHGIEGIDIVVVNLYPFEDTCAKYYKENSKEITSEIIENIDIGGVALLRAAAKNFNDVIVVCENADFAQVLEVIKSGNIETAFKAKLAAKAFRHTAYYDSLISNYFTNEKFTEKTTIPLKLISGLRYGENPHQSASLYKLACADTSKAVASAIQLQGKELSYNNYLDIDSAWKLTNEFSKPTCAIIKHNNPCGCASAKNAYNAYLAAYECDKTSAFGGILAFNVPVDQQTAIETSKIFTECIIAPVFSDKAIEIFAKKKNLRILTLPLPDKKTTALEFRQISGGMLVQDMDILVSNELKCVTTRQPNVNELEALKFAWLVCKNVKSNTIVLSRGKRTLGIGAGQMSRIDSLNIAAAKMKAVKCELNENAFPLVMASDAFFPFPDVVEMAAKIGVKAIIHPGGSIKDADSIEAANKHGIAMVLTGTRHFRH